MIEVMHNLWVGSQEDFELHGSRFGSIVQACKDPYHRQALGYKTQFPPSGHPEYHFAVRGNRLILNLIDPDNAIYVSKETIDTAIKFIWEKIMYGQSVLVHCNKGISRGPTIAFLYLVACTDELQAKTPNEAMVEFKKRYPLYSPSCGMHGFSIALWNSYCRRRKRR